MKRLDQRSGSSSRCADDWKAPAVMADIKSPRLCCSRLADASTNAFCTVKAAANRSSRKRWTSSGSHGAVRWMTSCSRSKNLSLMTLSPKRFRASAADASSCLTACCLPDIARSNCCNWDSALFHSVVASSMTSCAACASLTDCCKVTESFCCADLHDFQDAFRTSGRRNPDGQQGVY